MKSDKEILIEAENFYDLFSLNFYLIVYYIRGFVMYDTERVDSCSMDRNSPVA